MLHRSGPLAAGALAIAASLLAPHDARACGGCFHLESQVGSTVVTGHRMAFAVSTAHTVLWDQIQYSGAPGDFAWVLPVKAGAVLELSSDAWFETLEAATSARIVSPAINCGGGSGSSGCDVGCGTAAYDSGGAETLRDIPKVTVVHQGTVGPYETVTLHANVPGALPSWLSSHGYAIDPTVQPIVDAYTAEGFDFIALRLLPGEGVQQMKPVRVVTPGMSPALPLRMVAAGTGKNVAITLFVIGEGRWKAQNFPNAEVDPAKLVWDVDNSSSNYAETRLALLAQDDGRTWNSAYARRGALLSVLPQPVTEAGEDTQYVVGNQSFSTFAKAYLQQGLLNGETTISDCSSAFDTFANDPGLVVDTCGAGGGGGGGGSGGGGAGGGGAGGTGGGAPCPMAGPGEIAASGFACGPLDDIAVALTGLHPSDVWLTRLEANLPRAALDDDLVIEAGAQVEATNWFPISKTNRDYCADVSSVGVLRPGSSTPADHRRRNNGALAGAVVAAIAALLGRRLRRPALARQRR